MIQFLERLLSCRSAAEFHRIHRKAGDELSPLEIHWLLDRAFALPQPTQDWLADLSRREHFALDEPQRYVREVIAPGVQFYGDPDVPRTRKRLILGFCSYGHRLLMPAASFLQSLPSSLFDIVLLADFSRAHFMNGITPVATNLLDLTRWLEREFAPSGYSGFCCYGASGGGFPALRAGLLMCAPRAISVSGRLPGHVARLIGEETALPAFDPLCGCVRRPGTELIVLYCENNEADRLDADRLSLVQPLTHFALRGTRHHIPFAHLSVAQTRSLFGLLFGFDADPDSDSTSRLLRKATIPRDRTR